jgi:hypothetical protein
MRLQRYLYFRKRLHGGALCRAIEGLMHKTLISPALNTTTPAEECDVFLGSKERQIPDFDLQPLALTFPT